MSWPAQPIDLNTSGDHAVILATAYPGRKIAVQQMFLLADSSVKVVLKHGTTPFCGPLTLGGFGVDDTGMPWFVCETDEDFVINLSGNVQVSGQIQFAVIG